MAVYQLPCIILGLCTKLLVLTVLTEQRCLLQCHSVLNKFRIFFIVVSF